MPDFLNKPFRIMPEPVRVDLLSDAKKQKNTVIVFLSFYEPCINGLVRVSGMGMAGSIAD
ncbi:MAG: hypothetical protein BGO52_20335 [Sphingobacteriales bacterium 44-61]|nr:MAG: hypothetical protein BGO52_20335 [Sphingobacteriales bacterium 44-61]